MLRFRYLIVHWICTFIIYSKKSYHQVGGSNSTTLYSSLTLYNNGNHSPLCYGIQDKARLIYKAMITNQNIKEEWIELENTSMSVASILKILLDKHNENTLGVVRTDQSELLTISTYTHQSINFIDLRVDIRDHNTINGVMQSLMESSVKTVLVLLDLHEWNFFLEYMSLNLHKDLFFINLVSFNSEIYLDLPKCFCQFPIIPLLKSDSRAADLLVSGLLDSKTNCVIAKDRFVRVTSSLDDQLLFIVEHQSLEFGTLTCKKNAYPCRIPLDKEGKSWTSKCCGGFLVELGLVVFDRLGYSWSLYITPDGLFGSFANCTSTDDYTTCTWTGMVNELIQNRADLALGMLTDTSQRMQVVDFTENILTTTIGIAIRIKQEELSFINWKFLQSLDWTLLSALPFKLFLVCCCLFIAERIVNKKRFFPIKYNKREAFSYGAGLTFQRDLAGKTPNFWAARIVAISYAVALTIIMSTYMANLTATNISLNLSNGFEGMKDEKIVNPTDEFRYGIGKHTSTEVFFKTNTIHSKAHNHPSYHIIEGGVPAGMEKIYQGDLDGYISESLSLSMFLNKAWWYCDNIKVFDDEMIVPNSLATRKGSKLNAIVSAAIRDIKSQDGLKTMEKKWFRKCSGNPINFYAFTAEYAGGLVVAMGAFILIALVVLIFETLYVHRRTKYGADISDNNKNINIDNINNNNNLFHDAELLKGFTTPINKQETYLIPSPEIPEIKALDNLGYDFGKEASKSSLMLY